MRRLFRFLMGVVLLAAMSSSAEQTKTITLVNAKAVDADLLERVRAFAEKELHVAVRAIDEPSLAGQADFQALEKEASLIKTDADVEFIVLAKITGDEKHLAVFVEDGVAVVNATPLYTNDAETFARRIERQVMRAAAFTFGMPPTPDPFCVTRDYRSLEDLDRMGRNYSPPWMGRFAEEAAKRGLKSLETSGAKSRK